MTNSTHSKLSCKDTLQNVMQLKRKRVSKQVIFKCLLALTDSVESIVKAKSFEVAASVTQQAQLLTDFKRLRSINSSSVDDE